MTSKLWVLTLVFAVGLVHVCQAKPADEAKAEVKTEEKKTASETDKKGATETKTATETKKEESSKTVGSEHTKKEETKGGGKGDGKGETTKSSSEGSSSHEDSRSSRSNSRKNQCDSDDHEERKQQKGFHKFTSHFVSMPKKIIRFPCKVVKGGLDGAHMFFKRVFDD